MNHGSLEIRNEGERPRAAKRQQIVSLTPTLLKGLAASRNFRFELAVRADVIQHGGLDSAEAEIVSVPLDFHRPKIQSVLIVEVRSRSGHARGDLIDHRSAGISQREQPC